MKGNTNAQAGTGLSIETKTLEGNLTGTATITKKNGYCTISINGATANSLASDLQVLKNIPRCGADYVLSNAYPGVGSYGSGIESATIYINASYTPTALYCNTFASNVQVWVSIMYPMADE